MPRAVDGSRRKNRRKKILKDAKGFWGRRSKLFRTAKDAVAKSQSY
ncbi:MAG: 50S ribosomal protein L20, partial [Spirochaetota bacterium]